MSSAKYLILLAIFTSGCATKIYHPQISDVIMSERQQAMDEIYCKQIAGGLYIPPPVRIYQPTQYEVSGTLTRTLPGTANFDGTLRPSSTFASRFNQGADAVAPLAAAIAQRRMQDRCMMGLGWLEDDRKK